MSHCLAGGERLEDAIFASVFKFNQGTGVGLAFSHGGICGEIAEEVKFAGIEIGKIDTVGGKPYACNEMGPSFEKGEDVLGFFQGAAAGEQCFKFVQISAQNVAVEPERF